MDYKKEYDKKYWLEEIFNKNKGLTRPEKKLIKKAYFFADALYKNQKRKSGEPHFTHLIETAKNLAEIGMGGVVISAGILHDSLEKEVFTQTKIKEEFGEEVFFLISNVEAVGKIKFAGTQKHNESLRKLFVATSRDIRVLIIKFAERIHNLETLEYIKPEYQKKIATESLEIYDPLAYRLGIAAFSKKLGDLAFPYVYPEEYEQIKKMLKKRSGENLKNLEAVSHSVSKKLTDHGIKSFEIKHRVKAIIAFHKKLQKKNNNPDDIFDLIALRVIVPTVADCYKTLGIIHENFKPVPDRIKDYISIPKLNGYKSIHTVIFTDNGDFLEVQIRTSLMDRKSEFGAASHLGYKIETIGVDGLSSHTKDWIRKVFNVFKSPKKNKDVLAYKDCDSKKHSVNSVPSSLEKENLFLTRVFIFTPKGDVIDLPKNSTSVDLAYKL
jgi:guanosine-3',5'-bis(diphosphate) 3'-pyrophosphohydrolase